MLRTTLCIFNLKVSGILSHGVIDTVDGALLFQHCYRTHCHFQLNIFCRGCSSWNDKFTTAIEQYRCVESLSMSCPFCWLEDGRGELCLEPWKVPSFPGWTVIFISLQLSPGLWSSVLYCPLSTPSSIQSSCLMLTRWALATRRSTEFLESAETNGAQWTEQDQLLRTLIGHRRLFPCLPTLFGPQHSQDLWGLFFFSQYPFFCGKF